MTVPRAVARRVLALSVAVLGALVVPGVAAGSAGPPAPAATTATATGTATATAMPSPTATVDATALPVSVTVAAVEPAVLRPGDDLVVAVSVRNDSDAELAAPQASVLLSRFRMASRGEVATWSDAPPTAAAGSRATSAPLPGPLAPGATAELTLTVPAADVRLLDLPDVWGPRGLAVEVTQGRTRVGLARTYVLWQPAGDVTRARVAVVVPVVGPATTAAPPAEAVPTGATGATADPDEPDPAAGTDAAEAEADTEVPGAASPGGGAGDLEALTAPDGRLGRVLAATAGATGVTWAVDTALLAEAAQGGGTARAWAAAADEGPAARAWALPWGDPDAAALAHADRAGLVGVATSLAADAAATTGAGGAGSLAWTAGPADDATATAAAAAGAQVLVEDDPAATGEGGLATATTARGDVLVARPDPLLTDLLTGAADATSTGSAAASVVAARQRLLAETAVAARSTDEDRLLLAPGRGWEADVERTQALLGALADAPWVTTTDLAGLVAATGARTDTSLDLPRTEVSAAEADADDVRALADARTAARSFAAVATDPDALLDGVDATTLLPLSVAWRADPDGRAGAVDAALAALRDRSTGLSVAPVSTVNVVSARSELRMSVRSTLPTDATVRLEVEPDRACLAAPSSPTVQVPAGSEVAVPVDLVATANCDVSVRAVLVTADGTPVGEPVVFEARVSPTVESVGVGVVGALLAVMLVLGIVRTVRRGQSSTRGAGRGAEPGALGVLGGRGTDTGTHPVVPDPAARPTDLPGAGSADDRPDAPRDGGRP